MSFTTDIKSELCRFPHSKDCCALAEIYGIMLFSAVFSQDKIKIQSDSAQMRHRAQTLVEKCIGIKILEPQSHPNMLLCTDETDIEKAYNAFGYDYKSTALHLNRAIVEDDCCRWAFMRGAFLAGGCAIGGGKGYHLEFACSHYNVAREIILLLEEMGAKCGFVERRGNFVLYYKDSNVIEEVITSIGASSSAMKIMLKKVEKDFRNNINRRVNCETANISKTVDAAAKQAEAIRKLEESGKLESLPKALQETARIRMEHPENSLTELICYFETPITKPGLNNRMRKLIALAEE